MALRSREREQLVALQVVVDQVVQAHLVGRRGELHRQWHAPRKLDVLVRIFSERPLGDRCNALDQVVVASQVTIFDIPLTESIERVKVVRVEDRDEAVKFFELVLQRGRREENRLVRATSYMRDSLRNLRLAVPVAAQPVSFVGHHQVPRLQQCSLVPEDELVRADQHLSRTSIDLGEQRILRLRVKDRRRNQELLIKLLLPLLTQARGRDDQNAAFALGPVLREDDARLDRLPETNFVRQDHARQERGLESEERRVDLVRLRLNLRIEQQARQLADVIVGVAALQLVGEVLRLVVGEGSRHRRPFRVWQGRHMEAAAAGRPSQRIDPAALRSIRSCSSAPAARS